MTGTAAEATGATAFYRSGEGTPIPIGDAFAVACAEHPVLVPGLFRTIGALEVVLDHVGAAAGEVAGPAAAAGTNFHPYVDARLVGTPFARAAKVQSYVTAAALRSWWSQHGPRR